MYKATNVMSSDDIAKFCQEIQTTLESTYDADNPAAVINRAQVVEGYMALSGKMVADAKYRYNEILNSVFIKAVKDASSINMSASTMNKFIDSTCKDDQYLVDWTERLNRACTHQLDLCRSLISKLKIEMQQLQYR